MCIAFYVHCIILGCKDVSMEQRLRWLDVYECEVRVEVATGDGVSAPVTAASHVTLSHCHEDVTKMSRRSILHTPRSHLQITVKRLPPSTSILQNIFRAVPSQPSSFFQQIILHPCMRRAGDMTADEDLTRPAGDWCLLLGLLVKSNLTINWLLVAGAGAGGCPH